MTLERDVLLNYLGNKINMAPNQIEAEMALISSGLIDSFTMVELVLFIEKQCGIKIKPAEVNLDNLDSVSRILTFTEMRANGKNGSH